MAEPILQPGTNFLNPYEKMYSILKDTNPHFQEDIWNKVINGSTSGIDVNLYIDAIQKIKDMDVKALEDDYNLAYADWNARLMAQLNEAHKEENLQNIVKRERYVYNDDGSVKMENYEPVTEPYDVDNYTYTKELIRQQGEIGYQNYLLQQEKERKDSMSNFTKFMYGSFATLGHLVSGAVKEIDGMANFFEGIAAGVDAKIKGGDFQKGMADYITGEDASKEWGTQLENLLVDFEKRYTNLRDLDGNLTGAGKFFVSMADSFGQMAPSIIITAATAAAGGAIGGVAGAVISKGIPVISQTMFYSGITANQAREMYQYYAENGVTVPTESILTNAEMKAAGQAAVELMLGKLMGGSVLDNLTYGRSMGKSFAGKSFTGKGLSRIAHDFIEEGSEEVLQEFSDYFIDKIWQSVPNSNWGQFADITPENLGLSFVIGGISSFIGSAVRIIRTPNMKVAKSIDAEGNVTYKNLGKGVAGKIASWEYGITLQEAISNVNKIIQHRQKISDALSKTNILAEKFNSLKTDVAIKELARETQAWSERDLQKADVALTQAYAGYRMLASIYQEVGPERFNAANDILIYGSKNNDSAYYNMTADMLMNKLKSLGSVIPQKIITRKNKEKLVGVYAGEFRDLIIERRLGNVMNTFNKGDDNLSPSVKELFEKYSKANTIIVTDKGTGALETEDGKIIVPSPELNNAGASVVISDLCEQKLAKWVSEQLTNNKNLLGLRQIKDWYKEIYNEDPTDESLAYKLCFDDKFYRVVLFKANRDALNLLSSVIANLSKIDVKDVADGTLVSKFMKMIKMMKATLKQSLIYNFRADLQQIPSEILSEKDKKDIIKERWSQTLLYRIVNEHDKLTMDDHRKINLTVNNMVTLSVEKRQELLQKVFSVNTADRVDAVNEIRGYFDVYQSMYDGTKYMPENSVPGIIFNYFLRNKGIFIDDIAKEVNLTKSDIAYMEQYKMNIVQYRQHQFSEFCNNQYYFEFSTINPLNISQRSNISLYETNTRKLVGISNYVSKMRSKLDVRKSVTSTVTELSKDIRDLVTDFITDDLTAEQKQNVTMKDLIFDYGLLSDDMVVKMLQRFGLNSPKELTPQLKYTYFREYLPTVLDNISINITSNGDIMFLNYRPYKQTFRDNYKFTKKDIQSDALLSVFFKPKYLNGKLADTVIKIDNNRVKQMSYSSADNVIYVNSRYVNKASVEELKYALAHELQHGIADVNGLNSGFTENFSKRIKSNKFLTTLIADVKTHVPELFRDTDAITNKAKREAAEKSVLDDFLYFCSGETLAYGQEFTDLVTFYPILVIKQDRGRSHLVMPWGSKYDLENETTSVILQKKGHLIYDVLKTGTTELAKSDYLKNPLTSVFILNGNLYTTDSYEDMARKLRQYFHNLPDTDLENSLVSIKVENNMMYINADSSVLYSEDNKTSTALYEIVQKAMNENYEIEFQDKTREDVYGMLENESNVSIETISDKIAMLYEQEIEDDQYSLDDFISDEITEEISIRVPTVQIKPKRKYNKRDKDIVTAYHGSTEQFDKFVIGDLGFHLGTKEQAEARQAGASERNKSDNYQINEYQIKTKKPFIVEEDMINWSTYNLALECLFNADKTLADEFIAEYKNKTVPTDKFNEMVENVKERLSKHDNNAPQEFYERLTNLFINTLLKVDTQSYHQALKEYKAKYFDSQKAYKEYERKFWTDKLDAEEKMTERYKEFRKLAKKDYESYEHISQQKARDIFKKFGFDSIKYRNDFEGENPDYSYIVFDNSQIKPLDKSVNKNKGRYITDEQRETYESLKKVKTRQMSPELQKFYIGAEKNENIAPELRDEVLKGTLRWSSDKTDKMSISYYLRTASDINESTFDLINSSFFHNNHIKSFKELDELINNAEEIYAISKIYDDSHMLDLLNDLGINAINDLVRKLDDGKENKQKYNDNKREYGRSTDKGFWRPGGNIGYLRLNFLKYYDGTIGSAYQFIKELKGIDESKWNSWKKGYQDGTLQNKKGETSEDNDTLSNKAKEQDLSGADIFGEALRTYFDTRQNVAQDLEGIIAELQKPWANKTRYTLKSIYKFYRELAKVLPAGFENEALLETILDFIYEPTKINAKKQKWLAEHLEIAKFIVNARSYLIRGPLANSNYVAVSRDLIWFIIQKYGRNVFNNKETFLQLQKSIQELVSDDVANRFFDGTDDWAVVSDIEYEWVEAFESMNDGMRNFMKAIYQHYELPTDAFENEEKEQFTKILSGKELREPSRLVSSIKYYFRKLGGKDGLTPAQAELLANNNPDLFVYDKDSHQLSLNDDAYLVKTKTNTTVKNKETGETYVKENILTAYKLTSELEKVRQKIAMVTDAFLVGAYNNERALKSFNKAFSTWEKRISKLYRNVADSTDKKKSTQKIITYNIDDREYNIEGDGDMPSIIIDMMKHQNEGIDVRKSRVQFLSDDDDAHIVAAFSRFNKENVDFLESLTQNDAEQIVGFYLTHAILSDKWSTDFETVRTGLLGYILRMSNAFGDVANPKFVFSNDVIDKIESLLRRQSSKGGQYLRLQRSLLEQINPTKDFEEAISAKYGFKVSSEKIELLANAIDNGDINEVGKIKSEIVLDLLAQNRTTKNYNKFVKVLSKFVEKDGSDDTYNKLLTQLDEKIDDESKYGENSYIRKRLIELRDVMTEKLKLNIPSIELTDDMTKYFAHHQRLISQEYFNENKRAKEVFGTYDAYKNAHYTYQIEKQAAALNDYFNMTYKNTEGFLDKLWNFERAMMLTSPGTWVRNQVSDIMLHTTNRVSDQLMNLGDKLFSKSKKWHTKGQYKISSTKNISTDIKAFIDRLTDKNQENNIFGQIDDAINKYDARKITKNTPEMNLAELIINKLATDVSRGDIPYDKLNVKDERTKMEKAVAKSKKFLFKMLSDSRWIKLEFKRVLARMLVEENIDINKEGLSNKVQSIIAEAYTFAAQTYMHKSNFMNKFDDLIRQKAGSVGYFMWKQIFPFANASWNWFMEGLSYTPIGLAIGIRNLVKLENTIQRLDIARQKGETVVSSKFAEYLAKRKIGHGVIGTFGFIIGGLLAGFGKARLDDEDKKYKLIVGSISIDISDVFGTNGVLVGMALVQACQQNSGDNWFENFMYVINTVMNQMVLESSFSDLFNTIRYNKNLGDFMMTMGIYTIPSMFIPNFLKSLSSLSKYKVKYASGVVGKLERLGFQIAPYLTWLDSVPKYIDPYTGEKQVALKLGWFEEDWLIPSILNKYGPIDFKPYNVSRYEKEAIELGIKKSMLAGNYKIDGKDIDISGKTLEEMNKYYGQLNQSMLQRLFDDDIRMNVQMANGSYKELKYSQMTDKQKKNAIENIMEKNAKYSRIYTVTTKYDYKYFATEDEFQALKKLGITDNVYRANKKYKGFIKK